jgi:hypothetical protein
MHPPQNLTPDKPMGAGYFIQTPVMANEAYDYEWLERKVQDGVGAMQWVSRPRAIKSWRDGGRLCVVLRGERSLWDRPTHMSSSGRCAIRKTSPRSLSSATVVASSSLVFYVAQEVMLRDSSGSAHLLAGALRARNIISTNVKLRSPSRRRISAD